MLGGVAAVSLAVSGILQWGAAYQRWGACDADTVLTDGAVAPGFDFTGSTECFMHEDHLFDYSLPADPWVAIGTAAQLYGWAMLFLAVAIVLIAVAPVMHGSMERSRAVRSGTVTVAGAAVFAAGITVTGVHAILSGAAGSPSSWLTTAGIAMWVSQLAWIVWLVATALRTPRWSPPVLLLGAFTPIALIPLYAIAPLFVGGYWSHDSTPWTEAIPAYAAGLAAVLVVVALLPDITGTRHAAATRAPAPAVDPDPTGGDALAPRPRLFRVAMVCVAAALLIAAAVSRLLVLGWWETQTDPLVPAVHTLIASACTLAAVVLVGLAALTSTTAQGRVGWRRFAAASLAVYAAAAATEAVIAMRGASVHDADAPMTAWDLVFTPAVHVGQAAFLALLVAVAVVAPVWLLPLLPLGSGTLIGASIASAVGGMLGSLVAPGDFRAAALAFVVVPVLAAALAVGTLFAEPRLIRGIERMRASGARIS
ncbi:hypothetical protein RS81_01801 [Microbacterium terrae]|uniref:Uncharacterized protein n=1 Tax=Microbacterium terrae TaxID=69369 RepID=A0A0M2H0S1_9MICO|nr:hypothetical protein RS81_01801 [Microbacterium terrae]